MINGNGQTFERLPVSVYDQRHQVQATETSQGDVPGNFLFPLFYLFYLGVPAFWIRREPPFANTLALLLDFKN